MVKVAVLALALTAGCQVRPSDRDVFYASSDETGAAFGSDAGGSGSDGAVEGPGSDASGSGSDGGGSGSGSGHDGGTGDGDGGTGNGDGDGGTGSNGGNGPGLGNRAELDDKTSFYACSAGGFGGALVPIGAVIAMGLLRRRRRR